MGSEKKVFKTHKRLLCSFSTYFRAALDGNFKEASEQKIELLEDDPSVIERFQLWLYQGSILNIDELPANQKWGMIVKLYCFGQTRGIPLLENHIIDISIQKYMAWDFIHPTCLRELYRHSSKSAMCKLVVDISTYSDTLLSWGYLNDMDHDDVEDFPYMFLRQMFVSSSKRRIKQTSKTLTAFWHSRCDYHDHADDRWCVIETLS